jgi:hypothetical protein
MVPRRVAAPATDISQHRISRMLDAAIGVQYFAA